MDVAVILFNNFETLDVFGPVEIFGRLPDHYQLHFYSMLGGLVSNAHGVTVMSQRMSELLDTNDVLLIPGGYGTRPAVHDATFIEAIKNAAIQSRYVLTVCTGTALLAKTGLLDGRRATTNKRAFDWVVTQGPTVQWVRKARWVVDDKWYTSSGVTAGMDMTLDFLANIHGHFYAREVAESIEYSWQEDKENDPFAKA